MPASRSTAWRTVLSLLACSALVQYGGCSSLDKGVATIETGKIVLSGVVVGVDYIRWGGLFYPDVQRAAGRDRRYPKVRSFVRERFEVEDEKGRVYPIDRVQFSWGKVGYGIGVYLDSRRVPDDVVELRPKVSFVVNNIRFRIEDPIRRGPDGIWQRKRWGDVAVSSHHMPERSSSQVPGLEW